MNINEWSSDGLQLIKVENNVGLTITFANLGASVFSIYLNDEIMTMTTKNIADFKKQTFITEKQLVGLPTELKMGK